MTIEKPKDEECGNCYYCVSHMEKEMRGGGFFTPVEIRDHEVFECRRNPPLRVVGSMTTIEEIRLLITPTTSKIHWCGEWRRRWGKDG